MWYLIMLAAEGRIGLSLFYNPNKSGMLFVFEVIQRPTSSGSGFQPTRSGVSLGSRYTTLMVHNPVIQIIPIQ